MCPKMVAFTSQKMGCVGLRVRLYFWDSYKGCTNVETLEGSFQHTPGAYRDELLGANFGHESYQQHKGLRPFKTALLVILALLSDPLQTLSKPVIVQLQSAQRRKGRVSPHC